jgi:hypothetical protein
MLDEVSDARRLAVNRSPAFEEFVLSQTPVNELRDKADIRFDAEIENSLVLESDVDLVRFGGT